MPTERMGPPPGASPPMRMTASWSGSNDPTEYKSVARRCTPMASFPSDPQQTDRHRQTLKLCKKPLSQVIIAPRAQASKPAPGLNRGRCENTSDARRHAAKLCCRFGPLTPSARSANLIAGDGTKNGLPGRVEDWRASRPRHPDSATFPAPSTSHAACGFPALRAPICFTSGLMGPIIPGQLSVRRVALDSC